MGQFADLLTLYCFARSTDETGETRKVVKYYSCSQPDEGLSPRGSVTLNG